MKRYVTLRAQLIEGGIIRYMHHHTTVGPLAIV